MAVMIPTIDDSELKLSKNAEYLFYWRIKESLPDTYRIFYSVEYLLPPDQKNAAKEGEIDFVVAHPDFGILIVEVKGGEISYHAYNTQTIDAFKQADRNMHNLQEKIAQRNLSLNINMHMNYGYAVAFPDCLAAKLIAKPAHWKEELIIDSDDLPKLEARIKLIFDFWKKQDTISNGSLDRNSLLHDIETKILAPIFQLDISLVNQIKNEAEFFRMTSEQRSCLSFLENNPKAIVEGPSGTGKSFLAIKIAQRLAEQNLRVLLLCYNNLLEFYLKRYCEEFQCAGNIFVFSYHSLCQKYAADAMIPLKPPKEGVADAISKFWKEETAGALIDAADKLEDKYMFDVIIVDEAQDFFQDWWSSLDFLWRNEGEGRFYLFADPHQNIYNTPYDLPFTNPIFKLTTNYRNTFAIAEHLQRIVDVKFDYPTICVPGDPPQVYEVDDAEKMRECAERLLSDLIANHKLKPAQICVVSTHRKENTPFEGYDKIGRFPIAVLNRRNPTVHEQHIRFVTLHSFKGLESDVVIFINCPGPTDITPNHIYVGESRAKHRLFEIRLAASEG